MAISRRRLIHGLGATGAICLCGVARAQWPPAGAQPHTGKSDSSSPGSQRPGNAGRPPNAFGWGGFGTSGCTFAGARMGTGGVPQFSIYSGDRGVDEAFQREGEKLIKAFTVTPAGAFMNDSRSPNAFATPDHMFTNSYDGTIVLGVTLIANELRRDRGRGISVPAIMAHEFSHIYQFKEGSLLDAPTPVRELQADFLAGWYMARAGLNEAAMRPAMESFFEMGDRNFHSPDHHGTPDERLAALIAGYSCSAADISEAFDEGKSHVDV